jgi:hypothetical protein
LSCEDIKTIKGLRQSQLFTKDFVLKKKVGPAMKGWQLERIDGSEDDMPKAIETAKNLILELATVMTLLLRTTLSFPGGVPPHKFTTCFMLHDDQPTPKIY